ncbi:MAG: helix-turn-helix transcriptional regulator [Spirochaetes bacterium]|nr:helix-turn-helix transcriptional regulator [Spirochaetota bacterium]
MKERPASIASLIGDISEHITIDFHYSGRSEHPAGWHEEKAHSDYDIWLIESGTVTASFGGSDETVSAGDAFLMTPQMHYTAKSASGTAFILVHFDCMLGSNRRILHDLDIAGIFPAAVITKEASQLTEAHRSFIGKSPMAGLAMKGALTVLLARMFAYRVAHGGVPFNGVQERMFARMKPVFDYIAHHIDTPLSNDTLAETAGMALNYFCTAFKKATGMTPHRYIERIRMHRAREYLSGNERTVREVAAMLGYPDQFTFSKAFKKHFRVAPSLYMQEFRTP